MTFRVRFGPEAQVEYDEAVEWYERRRQGVGLALVEAVTQLTDTIARWPQIGPIVPGVDPSRNVHRLSVSRFPYHVVWTVLDDQELVYILAVAHDRRRPGYWTARTKK